MVKTWSPGEYTTDVEAFTFDLSKHVMRCYALSGTVVMRTTSSMNVMVAAEVSEVCRRDPTLQLDRDHNFIFVCFGAIGNNDRPHFKKILRPTTRLHPKLSRRKQDRSSAVTVDLRLKEKVRSKPFCLGWIDASVRVTKLQPGCGGGTVMICD